jgi:hypothetical protein
VTSSRRIDKFDLTVTLGDGAKWSCHGTCDDKGVHFVFPDNQVHTDTMKDLAALGAEIMAFFTTQLERARPFMK